MYGNALSFNFVKSILFINMMKSISEYDRGLKLPVYHEVDLVHANLDKYKLEWKITGCTLMSDRWTDRKGPLLIFLLIVLEELFL